MSNASPQIIEIPKCYEHPLHRFAAGASIVAVLGLSVAFLYRAVMLITSWQAGLVFAASIVAGLIWADFMSGLVHWMADRYGTVEMPFLGNAFIKPFRIHHIAPEDITMHGFLDTNGNNSIVTLPVLLAAYIFINPAPGNLFGLFTIGSFVMMCIFVFLTNQTHKWAHMETPPPVLRFLGKFGLVLTPEHHEKHHTDPYDQHYCITVGWLNPLLDGIKFFPFLERVVKAVTGIEAGEHGPYIPGFDENREFELKHL